MAVAELSVDRGWVGVELRHLTALAAIARTNSFVRAARSLGYTQSAISAQIAALERAVGVQLISRARGSRFVHLTPEGEILLAHAAVVTSELERARARLSERLWRSISRRWMIEIRSQMPSARGSTCSTAGISAKRSTK